MTCEQVQVEKFRNGTNETDDKGMNFDVWLYAVSNPDDVLTGKHPRMMTIGPFELRKQRSDREISSFMDGEVSYRVGTTYKFREEEPTDVLDMEIVVPNIMYTALIANPLYEEIFLSIVSGMAFKMQGMGIQALNATLRKMGSFTNAEVWPEPLQLGKEAVARIDMHESNYALPAAGAHAWHRRGVVVFC